MNPIRATPAPSQCNRGGLEGMVSPLRRGSTQLPVRSISCMTRASRPSMVR